MSFGKENRHSEVTESLKSKSNEPCESEDDISENQNDQEFESKVSKISISSSTFMTKNLETCKGNGEENETF